ncbi:MAG TPA: hypothetical protein VGL53_15855 [Bryobacteraceae bacterium]|jgi:hypothetical protein
MQAITDWIWLGGTMALALLIVRGAMTGLVRRFPFFFVYLCVVLANTVTAAALIGHPVAYVRFYWIWSQPVSLIAFTLVLGEIQELLQLQAPGFRSVLRWVMPLGFGLLAVSLIFAIWSGSFRLFVDAMATIERVTRELQAGYLAVLVGFVLYYRIRLRPDAQGILLGYSLITSAGILSLAGLAVWKSGFNQSWAIIQPMVFCIALLIWLRFLWHETEDGTAIPVIPEDYQGVHSRTTRAYARMHHVLSHMLRT